MRITLWVAILTLLAVNASAQESPRVQLETAGAERLKAIVVEAIRPFTIADLAKMAREIEGGSGYFGMRQESRPKIEKYGTQVVVTLSARGAKGPGALIIQVSNERRCPAKSAECNDEKMSFVQLFDYAANNSDPSLPFGEVLVVYQKGEALLEVVSASDLPASGAVIADRSLITKDGDGIWFGRFVWQDGAWFKKLKP